MRQLFLHSRRIVDILLPAVDRDNDNIGHKTRGANVLCNGRNVSVRDARSIQSREGINQLVRVRQKRDPQAFDLYDGRRARRRLVHAGPGIQQTGIIERRQGVLNAHYAVVGCVVVP